MTAAYNLLRVSYMDVVKEKKTNPFSKYLVYLLPVVGGAALLFTSQWFSLSAYSVDDDHITVAKVKKGELMVKVSAPGVLSPQKDRWISAVVDGKIDLIYVKPGASVSKGDVIAELINVELLHSIESLSWDLDEIMAQTDALREQHKSRILDMQSHIEIARMDAQKQKIRLIAEKVLIDQGNSTVSILDYKERQLTIQQLQVLLETNKKRLSQLRLTLAAEQKAQQARIQRLNNQYNRLISQKESLRIAAPFDGVLQEMPGDLGQQIVVGQNIAKFARSDDLIAELQVPEFKAGDIKLGQKVYIDTRSNIIEGSITRIAPLVVNGTVQVDVELGPELPADARPDLSITGEIILSKIQSTLYVRRPAYSQEQQELFVFKVDKSSGKAEQVKVKFGIASTFNIAVERGLSEGDLLIVSDISDFQRYDIITIN